MSQKQSGVKPPTKIVRPSGLPQPKTGSSGPSKAQSPEPQNAVPPDDFKIGDRVFVGGTKAGVIAYIGETQFAPAEWAGVVLDELVGKNDGSVAGVRYFQCEPKKGVFSRLSKLTKQGSGGQGVATPPHSGPATPVLPTPPTTVVDSPSPPVVNATPQAAKPKANGMPAPAATLVHAVPKTSTPKPSGLVKRGGMSTSQTNLSKASPSGSITNLSISETRAYSNFKVGDRVVVSGSKVGVLRYIGETEFAKGDWVGVELDEPMGKNDGSVAGKRYFDCRPLYGLFAPTHKVVKSMAQMLTPMRRSSLSKPGLGLSSLSRRDTGSQDSISSIGSACSNTSRTRVPKTSTRPTQNLSATTSALQKAMKEKEEHIEQLLRERDMERHELVKSAALVDEAENELAILRAEHQRLLEDRGDDTIQLKTHVDKLEREKRDLFNQVEEEKRKVEDLQFAIEEETINKSDLESQSEAEQARMRDMQNKLKAEADRADNLQKQIDQLKGQLTGERDRNKEAANSSDYYLDRIEELTHKLNQAEKRNKSWEAEKEEEGEKVTVVTEELNQRNQRVAELEGVLADRERDVRKAQNSLTELQEELSESQAKRSKQQETIDDLMSRLGNSDTTSNNLTSEIQQLKQQLSESQRQLNASEEKCHLVVEDKTKLEHQISELMKHSGDSSEQLSLMNEQLLDRDRKLAEVQAALSDSTQRIGRLTETAEGERARAEREMETVVAKHHDDMAAAQQQLQDTQNEVEKANNKLTKAKETHEQEKQELLSAKDTEVSELKTLLQKAETEVKSQGQEVKASKEVIEQLQTENENVKFEKEKLDKAIKRLDTEKQSLVQERDEIQKARDQLVAERDSVVSQQGSATQQLEQLQAECQKATEENTQLKADWSALEAKRDKLETERGLLIQEQKAASDVIHDKESLIQELTKKVDDLSSECTTQTDLVTELEADNIEKEHALADIRQQLVLTTAQSKELTGRISILETERQALKMQVTALKAIQEQKLQLESQQEALQTQIEDLKQRHSRVKENLEGERATMKHSLETTQLRLKQRDTDLRGAKDQIEALHVENETLQKKSSQTHNLEKEKRMLEKKVAQLERSLSESQANANIMANMDMGDPAVAKMTEDRDMALGQVQFLNSVIVDLQRKNEEKEQRLLAMEAGTVVNGTADLDIHDAHQTKMVAPRLFCDICEVFDQHDTDDCPKQEMDDSPPASLHHGTRTDDRPYCEICEVFGHYTSNCDDEQTF